MVSKTEWKRRESIMRTMFVLLDPNNEGVTIEAIKEKINEQIPNDKGGHGGKKYRGGVWQPTGQGVGFALRRFKFKRVKDHKPSLWLLPEATPPIPKPRKRHASMNVMLGMMKRYYNEPDLTQRAIADELGVTIATVSSRFSQLRQTAVGSHIMMDFEERTGLKKKPLSGRPRKPTAVVATSAPPMVDIDLDALTDMVVDRLFQRLKEKLFS